MTMRSNLIRSDQIKSGLNNVIDRLCACVCVGGDRGDEWGTKKKQKNFHFYPTKKKNINPQFNLKIE